MKPSKIHEWILKVVAPLTGIGLLVIHGISGDAGRAGADFYLLIGALIAARWVGDKQ